MTVDRYLRMIAGAIVMLTVALCCTVVSAGTGTGPAEGAMPIPGASPC